MKPCDLLINAKWVIPIEPDNTVLNQHSLAITNGKIIDILPTLAATEKYQANEVRQLSNHALLPGLINCHTHTSMSLLRGYADDLPLMDWLQNYIWPVEAQWVSEEFVYDGTQLAIVESIRSGVTCFNEMYFFPDQAARACIEADIRASIGLIIIDFPTVWASNANEYLDKAQIVHDDLRQHPLITTTYAPHAPYTVSDEPLKKIQMFAEELDIPIHMHVHETAHEVEESIKQYGKRPLARLQDLGLLSPRLHAVHMTQLTAEEIELCQQHGVSIVHCPESNMKLASGYCEVEKLRLANINVALGTDGAASNNDLDMMGEMRSAALLGKAVAHNAAAVPAHSVLRMATLNGAKALGLDAKIGSLEVGKMADIIAIDLNEIETQPVYNPISTIVYSANRHNVSDVWVAGKLLLKDKQLTTLDEAPIRTKAAAWAEKISSTIPNL